LIPRYPLARIGLGVGLFVLGCTAQPAQTPGPVGSPEGAWREQIHWVPTTEAGGNVRLLQARICRPQSEEPARVVVIAHGTPPGGVDSRSAMALPSCNSEAARWFLSRQFLVAASLRRGYGATGGEWEENSGPCSNPDFVHSGIESALDIGATVDYVASLPYARPQGVVLVGQSAGGWASIAYDAMPHPRVTALINMAGGRGGHHGNRPNSNCRPDLLAEAAGHFGRDASTPMLWIYTENDSYFSPGIAAVVYEAFTRNGGKAEFDQLGPYGSDGHRLFSGPGGSQIWGPLVERYLAGRPST
jgi:dienelactone hydrolase